MTSPGGCSGPGWVFCAGDILAIASNQALFSLLGTTYGGDGRTTYGIPDLRGRIAFQFGQGPGLPNHRIGNRGGNTIVTQTVSTMASHQHGDVQIGTATIPGTLPAPVPAAVPAIVAESGGGVATAYSGLANATSRLSGENSITGSTGGGQSITIQNPYIAISYEMATIGIFPSRN